MKHPKIRVRPTKWEKFFNLLSMVVIAGSIGYVLINYSSLPEEVPTHYNAMGEADDWGSKVSTLVLPFIAVVMFLSLYFFSKVPHLFNYPMDITEDNAERIYPIGRLFLTVLNFEMVFSLSGINVNTVYAVLNGTEAEMFPFVILLLIVPMLTIIGFLIKMNHVAS